MNDHEKMVQSLRRDLLLGDDDVIDDILEIDQIIRKATQRAKRQKTPYTQQQYK